MPNINLNWNDIQLTPQEFIDIFTEAAKNSSYFTDWNSKWHPEDMFYNMDSVLESLGNGLAAYTHILGERFRDKQRTAVFGGTIPTSELSNDSPASYARNTAFGDNV